MKLWCWCRHSQPTCLSASGTMITVTNSITMAIITIRLRTNVHTYPHNWKAVDRRLCWKIWVRDLLSSRANWLPFPQNLTFQLSTRWLWGIVRCGRGEGGINMIQTTISTAVMMLATIFSLQPTLYHLTATNYYLSPALHHPVAGEIISARLWIVHAEADSRAVEFSILRFSLMENSEVVESFA